MEVSVDIEKMDDTDFVVVTGEFESGERPLGKYKWNIRFLLYRQEGQLRLGISNEFMSEIYWSIPVGEHAIEILSNLLVKKRYKVVTKAPIEREGSGFVSIVPSNFVEWVRLDDTTANMIQTMLIEIAKTN
jgi:hypothetical protein